MINVDAKHRIPALLFILSNELSNFLVFNGFRRLLLQSQISPLNHCCHWLVIKMRRMINESENFSLFSYLILFVFDSWGSLQHERTLFCRPLNLIYSSIYLLSMRDSVSIERTTKHFYKIAFELDIR